MKFINKYTAILSACFGLASCEKEITVDVPAYQPKLVLNSYSVVGDTMFVSVGKSIGILDYKYGKDLGINNATVVLKTDGQPDDVLEYDAAAKAYRSHTATVPGKNYTLIANATGFSEAQATTIIPAVVPIDSMRRIAKSRVDMDGNEQDEIRIMFKDPPTAGDYYIVTLTKISINDSGSFNSSSDCINTTDASVESIYSDNIDQTTCLSGDGIFLRDALFNGTNKELRLFVQSNYLQPAIFGTDTVYAEIQLLHVTEAYFRFSKSYRFASDNLGNPFAEPTNVYTNVKNGYGIFSVMSVDTKTLR